MRHSPSSHKLQSIMKAFLSKYRDLLNPVKAILVILVAWSGLPGCASTDPSPQIMQTEQGERAYQTGVAAMEMWRYDVALGQFMDSLRWNQSVENAAGILKALHAITATFQAKGELESALESANTAIRLGLSPDSAIGFPNPEIWRPLWVESYWIRATIHARISELDQAQSDLTTYIQELEGRNDSSQDQKIANLQSFIALKRSNPEQALVHAEAALRLAGNEKDSSPETATAWQRLAEAQEALEDLNNAEKSWSQSLQLNRKLGRSDRMITALEGLARIQELQNQPDAAQEYRQRAQTIQSALSSNRTQ